MRLLFATICASCVATSKMGEAVVTEVDDELPCFSVSPSCVSQVGMPLDALAVTRIKSNGDVGYPKEVWYFRIIPPGETIVALPKTCIRYGKLANSAQQEKFSPLLSHQAYSAFMDAAADKTEIEV